MRWFFIVLMLLVAGCSSPSLIEKHDDLLGISVEGETVSVQAKKIKEDRINLSKLTVRRTLYALENGERVVFELAVTQPPNMFSYSVKESLRYIFKAQKVRQIDRVGNLGFYAITLSSDKSLLAIAENMNKKGIKMVYGLTIKQLDAAISKSGGKASVDSESLHSIETLSGDDNVFQSVWQPKLIIMDGLIKQAVGMPGMM